MKTALNNGKYFYPALEEKRSYNVFQQFLHFAQVQEKNHFGWVGTSIMLQAAVLFPITMLTLVTVGAPFYLIGFAIAALAMVVVSNLAALPTKYTIPTLLISAVIDIVLVVIALL